MILGVVASPAAEAATHWSAAHGLHYTYDGYVQHAWSATNLHRSFHAEATRGTGPPAATRSISGDFLASGFAAEAGGGADFVAGSDGTVISTSRARLEGGLQDAGFPANAATAPGMEHELPDGTLVRIMEPSGQAPLRASFTNENGGPINPFTGKPVQPPLGLSPAERLAYVRSYTHLELGP
jgi:hypothetical protein